ncbi:TonB-dependent receptor plug domain-containing protein [Roseovarius sp. SYSU LYC5161]|uniref:TonB-dependent receptor plug domain-containing protein n=1 Tax=Roseovarius halophilus (ex Wu et al. 2025) TaxID=3376060 RepID=UPI00399A6249
MTRQTLWASTALIALSTPLAAQQAFELDEIIVSGNLDETTLERIGTTASVVTRDDLEESGEARVIDYIARLPGVDVRARGPVGTKSSITVRGAGQNYVRVLVDGIDVTDTSGTQVAYDFGSLRTADVSRIEILRGGQGALYGSESIGGVVNITTRRATEEGLTTGAAIELGSYNTLAASYGLTMKQGDMDHAFTLSSIQTDGFSAADENDGNDEADGYRANRLSFALGRDLAGGGRVEVNGFYEDSYGEYDEGGPVDGSPDEATDNTALGLRAMAQLPTGAVDSEFAVTYYAIDRDTEGSTDFFSADNLYQGRRLGLSYLGKMSLNQSSDLRFGTDFTHETFDRSGSAGPASGESDTLGIFSELTYAPSDNLDLVGNLRVDEHSQFGTFTTGRLAASWRVTPDYIVRSSAATAFRAPSLYELFGDSIANPDLNAEESRSVDLGIERRIGQKGFVRATVFYNETENLIDYSDNNTPDDYDDDFYANVPGTVTRNGLELELGLPLTDAMRLDASYTYTEGDNPPLDQFNAWNLEFPTHDISATLSGDVTERVSGSVSLQRAMDRPTLDDYTVVNAKVGYALSDGAEAYMRVDNLLDTEYQTQAGYGTSDRAFYVGLRAQF